MSKENALRPLARANAVVAALVLAGASLLPIMLNQRAGAAQLGDRFIDMSATQTSAGSGRDGGDSWGQNVTYSVNFVISTSSTNLEGVVIDFCSNSPVVGLACTAPAGFNLNGPTVGNSVGTYNVTGWATTASDANTLVLSDATGLATTANGTNNIAFDITGITNPTSAGSFYARIVTYDTDTVAQAYDSSAPGANNPGANTDEGGIALAVANELTVTARVQEILEFCIGTDEASWSAINANTAGFGTEDSCTQISGTDIDLGVISQSVSTSSDALDNTSPLFPDDWNTGNDGVAMIRTNAVNGATIYYKAEQDNTIAYTNGGEGQLRQQGVDDCGTATALNNACFNSAGTTQQDISAMTGPEGFGMTGTNLNTTAGGATSALSCDAQYDGDGACTVNTGTLYAWLDTGAFDTIASSSGPMDDEMINLEFGAIAAPTTPTGLYTVTANFVATATF